MATPRQPQDRLPKTSRVDNTAEVLDDGRLRFTVRGDTWTSSGKVADALTVGAVRKHRDDEIELLFAMIDGLFWDQPEAAAALDLLPMSQLVALSGVMQTEFGDAGEATLGESSSSSNS